MGQQWKLALRIANSEWVDCGIHEIPDDINPKEYVEQNIGIQWMRAEPQFTWDVSVYIADGS